MIKKLLNRNNGNTYQRNPPSSEDPRFYKYLNKEVQFYRNLAKSRNGEFLTHKYLAPKKNGLEKDL